MIEIISVRFKSGGKQYYFNPNGIQFQEGDGVIVETTRGQEYAQCVQGNTMIDEIDLTAPLRPVVRLATAEDAVMVEKNQEKEKKAFAICQEKILQHGLDMKLIDAEYTFDNNKVLFYFTADGRIDFRELVKDLAAVFKTRIELRQIGVRDETKILGGMGICGRPLCCHTYLSEFAPVSIKMAKEQNLSLNPTKISGVCGRLMCCLKNEQETYEYLNKKLPNVGDHVTTPEDLKGEVTGVNVLRQMVKVLVDVNDEKELREYPVSELKFRPKHKKDKGKDRKKDKTDKTADGQLSAEEMKELEKLNQLAWQADEDTILGWADTEGYPVDGTVGPDGQYSKADIPEHTPYDTQSLAKFAFSMFWRAMRFAEEQQVPILLDY